MNPFQCCHPFPMYIQGQCSMPSAELLLRPFLSTRRGLFCFGSSSPVAGHWKKPTQVGAARGMHLITCRTLYAAIMLGGGMKSKKELSVWRKGMGPSCTWQMAELFTANTYPVKLEFFWSRFFHGQIVVSYHTICICWCKHVWTQGHLCSLLVSSALPFLWD